MQLTILLALTLSLHDGSRPPNELCIYNPSLYFAYGTENLIHCFKDCISSTIATGQAIVYKPRGGSPIQILHFFLESAYIICHRTQESLSSHPLVAFRTLEQRSITCHSFYPGLTLFTISHQLSQTTTRRIVRIPSSTGFDSH